MSILETSNYEFRCDLCNEFLHFHSSVIQSHYESRHKGQRTNYEKYTDLQALEKQPARQKTTHFVSQVNANEIENDPELAFISPETIARARNFANAVNGRLYKFKTLADGYAHKKLVLGEGETAKLDIFMSADERKRAARTLYGKDVNINHYLFAPTFNYILDADEVGGAVCGLMLIEDQFVNTLYDKGLVNGVSVEYYRRKETCSCTSTCNCEHFGVVFVGMAVISEPFTPADSTSQLVEVLSAELEGLSAKRLISQVQSDLKRRIIGERRELQLSNDNHLSSQGKCEKQSDQEMNEQEVQALVSQQIAAIKTQYENTITTLQQETKSLKADLLSLQDQQRKQRDAMSTGRATLDTPIEKFTKEELAEMLPARLESASLAEIVYLDAAENGVNIRNEAELSAWLSRKTEASK